MLIYCACNTVNGKVYIGQTRRKLEQRWRAHVSEAFRRNSERYLCRALRKYGKDSFLVFELCRAASLEQLNELEKLWVCVLRATDGAYGYNRTYGGDSGLNEIAVAQMARTKTGVAMPQAQREKIKASCTGIKWSDESKSKWKGHSKSQATKDKIKAALRGNRNGAVARSPQTRQRMRIAALAREAAKRKR